MKVALCTSDFFHPVQEVLREGNHEIAHVFTSCDLDSGFSDRTRQFADEMRAPFTVGHVTHEDVDALAKAGVELLISAAYDYKIPTPQGSPIKFINVHGSLLPEGRGPWPQPWILMRYPNAAGVTFHSMSQKWDHGDIVLQRAISIGDRDNMDTLVAKTLVQVRQLSEELLTDFYNIWSHRKRMEGTGSYWKKPTTEDMTIDLSQSVGMVDAIYRAFGTNTLFSDQTDLQRKVVTLSTWRQAHQYEPGERVTTSPPREIYALKDGFLAVVADPI